MPFPRSQKWPVRTGYEFRPKFVLLGSYPSKDLYLNQASPFRSNAITYSLYQVGSLHIEDTIAWDFLVALSLYRQFSVLSGCITRPRHFSAESRAELLAISRSCAAEVRLVEWARIALACLEEKET